MIEQEHIESDLQDLDRRNDPSGGAAWALLAVGAAIATAILLTVMWAAVVVELP